MSLPAFYAKLEVRCSMPVGQNSVNVYWYEASGDPGEVNAAAQDLAEAAVTLFKTPYVNFMHAFGSFQSCYAEVYSGALGGTYEAVDVGSGTAGSPGAPNFVAGLIQLHTEIPGASGRGRRYIPNVPAGLLIGNEITPLTSLEAVADAVVTPISVGAITYNPRQRYKVAGIDYMVGFVNVRASRRPATMKSRQVS